MLLDSYRLAPDACAKYRLIDPTAYDCLTISKRVWTVDSCHRAKNWLRALLTVLAMLMNPAGLWAVIEVTTCSDSEQSRLRPKDFVNVISHCSRHHYLLRDTSSTDMQSINQVAVHTGKLGHHS